MVIDLAQLRDEVKLVQTLGWLFLFFGLTDAEFTLINENLLNVVPRFFFLNKKNVLKVELCVHAVDDYSHLVFLAHIILIVVLSVLVFL